MPDQNNADSVFYLDARHTYSSEKNTLKLLYEVL